MVLKAAAKLSKSPNSATLYLAIPADVVKDSQFPFVRDEVVSLEVKQNRTIVISGKEAIAATARRAKKMYEEEEE